VRDSDDEHMIEVLAGFPDDVAAYVCHAHLRLGPQTGAIIDDADRTRSLNGCWPDVHLSNGPGV
jgi:hypothetical protein